MSTTPGPKSQPRTASLSAATFSGDLTKVADYAAFTGNYIVGTSTQRTSFTHPDWPDLTAPWEGLFWQESDGTRDGYLYTGTGWVFVSRPRSTTAGLNYNSGYGNAGNMRIARANGIVTAMLALSKVTPFTDADVPGTMPTGFRPTTTLVAAGVFSGGGVVPVFGSVTMTTAGVVTLSGTPGPHPAFYANLSYEHS